MTAFRFPRPWYMLGLAVVIAALALVIALTDDDNIGLPELPEGTTVIASPNLQQIEQLQRQAEARRARGAPYPSVVELIDENRDARVLVSVKDERAWWAAVDPGVLALLLASAVFFATRLTLARRR